jgi:hypothetical protein
MSVYVVGAEDTRSDIILMRGGTVSGSVRVFDFGGAPDSSQQGPVEIGGQPNITMELANPTDTLRRLTDGHGEFRFGNIRPGEWTLRAIDGMIPANSYMERDTLQFEVRPGEKREILFRVLPRKRVIKIIQEGTLDLTQPTPVLRTPPVPFTTADGCVVSPLPNGKGYVVQVSVWNSKKEATRAAQAIKRTTGIPAKVTTSEGRLFRVMMGAFASELEAATACTRARQAGQ